MRKKAYIVPMTEIVQLTTARLMGLGDTSGHASGGSSGAPRNPHAMPAGGTKVF